MHNTRRKRNTTRDSRDAPPRSSLSESAEGLRPQQKRAPQRNEWRTPKGVDLDVDAALNGLPDEFLGDDMDLFGSLGGSLGSLGGSVDMLPPPPNPDLGLAPTRLAPTRTAPRPAAAASTQPAAVANSAAAIAAAAAAAAAATRASGPEDLSPWEEEEDAVLREAVLRYGLTDWAAVSRHMLPSHCHRSAGACASRWLTVKDNVVKGPWLSEEDQLLRDLVGSMGAKKWSTIAASIPGRVGKQCRERWLNHLDASVKKSDWSAEEVSAGGLVWGTGA